MNFTERLNNAIIFADQLATTNRWEFLTPEVLVLGIYNTIPEFINICNRYSIGYDDLKDNALLANTVVPATVEDYILEPSEQFTKMFEIAYQNKEEGKDIDVPDIFHAIMSLEESYAHSFFANRFEDEQELLDMIDASFDPNRPTNIFVRYRAFEPDASDFFDEEQDSEQEQSPAEISMVCINDQVDKHNPLIGREKELDRTIQVLCRKDKNNPLHIGEAGVGKTALIYGLAQRINEGRVPKKLLGAKIFQFDLSQILAGTKFRGEMEKHVKKMIDSLANQENAIVYIDEIHNIIGAGAVEGNSTDIANLLKPHFESGDIRFIGATTYKEYNKYFQVSQPMVRRFQKIDILEPSIDDAVKILEGLKTHYEKFHEVKYEDGLMRYVVEMSAKYITDRFLPDKAIDLIDETGAYCQMQPRKKKIMVVDRNMINETLKRICRLTDEMLSTTDSGNESLEGLQGKLQSQIYGQDKAIENVVQAVQIAKAGLNEADKPLASLLFVGPTGVGKTELCRVLAKELGVELVRFDMSEYAEKHTIAKLIGSPAGYVGYDDGGLLTDAIRKSPNCVLLFDEIEKAHQDVYNILLQVMDYAKLTDNRGFKADFKNVILVMTSNAGAQYASMASIGFGSTVKRGDAMLSAVKKTFKPEFINRLTDIVVFNDMNEQMAQLILNKKINLLNERLKAKNVELELSEEANKFLFDKGFSVQYGAREMDRVIRQYAYTPLIKTILFGKLKNGGVARLIVKDNKLEVE